jgi:hypothetical protein
MELAVNEGAADFTTLTNDQLFEFQGRSGGLDKICINVDCATATITDEDWTRF